MGAGEMDLEKPEFITKIQYLTLRLIPTYKTGEGRAKKKVCLRLCNRSEYDQIFSSRRRTKIARIENRGRLRRRRSHF